MKAKWFICRLLLLFYQCLWCQTPSLQKAEKKWAFWHPFAAVKVKHIANNCDKIYLKECLAFYPDTFFNGGKPDAFRHSFYMAAFAQKINFNKLMKLGEAHEKSAYNLFLKKKLEEAERPDSLACVMDLKNNLLGLNLGKTHKHLNLDALAKLLADEINQGHGIILKRKKNGNYITCSNQIIELLNYVERWYIPKCLVGSNFIYID